MRKKGTLSRKNLMILMEALNLLDSLYRTESEKDDEPPIDLEVALLDGASNLENVINYYKGEQ